MDANERIATLVPEEGGTIMSKNVLYEVGNLPKVEAATASHPYSGGAWSAMLQSYKVSGRRAASSIFFSDACKRKIHGVSLFFPPSEDDITPTTATLAHLFRPKFTFSPPPFLEWNNTMNEKIIPKFRKYAEEHGESGKSPVVIVTCSFEQKMCTYYVVSIDFLCIVIFITRLSLYYLPLNKYACPKDESLTLLLVIIYLLTPRISRTYYIVIAAGETRQILHG